MRALNAKLIAAGLLFGTLCGCSTNSKFVTAVYEYTDNDFYVAYTDFTESMMGLSSSFTAAVRKCSKQKDNAVVCTEQAELNKLLNAESTKK